MKFPTKKETIIVLAGTIIFLLTTAIFIGLRPEHFYITLFFLALFFCRIVSRDRIYHVLAPPLFFLIPIVIKARFFVNKPFLNRFLYVFVVYISQIQVR